MERAVEGVKLARLEEEVDPAEGNERRRLDVETRGELDVWDKWGRGVEVEVLGPAAVEVRVLDVVGGSDDVRVECARKGKEVVLRYGI